MTAANMVRRRRLRRRPITAMAAATAIDPKKGSPSIGELFFWQTALRSFGWEASLAGCRSVCYILNHMVQYSQTRFDASFAALSDATRRGVLERLGRSDASITDL